MIRRPYVFDDDNDYSYSKFVDKNKKIANSTVARSKLKGLRNAFGISPDEAKRFFNYISSHINSNDDFLDLLTPFNNKNESEIFDCLDIMDIAWEK